MIHNKKKLGADNILLIIFYVLLTVIAVVCIFPIIFAVIGSFTPESEVAVHGFTLFPRELSLETYQYVFQSQGSKLLNAYKNSILTTLCGTALSVLITVCYAYVLSVKGFRFGNKLAFFAYFTMLFNGGMIPTYILIKNLGMLDTIWALVIPTSISVWNLIITRTYFQSTIPGEVQESASVDGCDDFTFLIKIAIPLAKPILAVNVLLYAVGHWNSYFNEMMYLSTNTKFPLQLVLREILVNMGTAGMTLDVTKQLEMQETKYLLQYSSIIVGSVPVMLLYPFVQKYFVKGIMVGAIKG